MIAANRSRLTPARSRWARLRYPASSAALMADEEASYADVDLALASAMWLVLMEYEASAIESGDMVSAMQFGGLLAEIRDTAKGMLMDADHPIWQMRSDS